MAAKTHDYEKIPRGVDDPSRLLIWRGDEIIPFLVLVCIGFFIQHLFLCILFGVISVRYYKKFNDNAADGYLLHMMYWWGFVKGSGHSFKNPFIRRWYP